MVTRILVEKKMGFDVEAAALKETWIKTLHIKTLTSVRLIHCYDFEGIEASNLEVIKSAVLSEPNVDVVTEGDYHPVTGEKTFRMALMPGTYDQRADSALQCIEIVTLANRPEIQTSKIIVLTGELSRSDVDQIKKYLINPVESHEVPLSRPTTLKTKVVEPVDVPKIEGFMTKDFEALEALRTDMGLAMSSADVAHVQRYFIEENRNPTLTEIKVIDTYWSDHCRHTTFMTALDDVFIDEGAYAEPIKTAYENYREMRNQVYGADGRLESLMDLATINMKSLRKSGGLEDLDVSEEINACSIHLDVDVNGALEPWLLMFKNETHNHPTEIEPFGGAATCLGGAIRDPLSGRSYVYQGMRVTGCANPNTPFEQTLEGKLPQRVITQKAAAGFSSYGNQIGLSTGLVSEVYHDGYVAKRMEVGAVIGAAPLKNVVRETPVAGDLILLIGGRTGRDGVGGATGSSKAHDEESLLECGAEVQKGNPPEERKIQRLFRNAAFSSKIKRCNDFGAGGVSVAIGELADSLEIQLDAVPKKYEGLDGTELAISESQERMAVVIHPDDMDWVLEQCAHENLEATLVAKVCDHGRLIMTWRRKTILDLSRAFLDTNGVKAHANARVVAPEAETFFEQKASPSKETFLNLLNDLNVCSQKGLVERFDNTIGSGAVLMPFGGKRYLTPTQTMVSKLPVLQGETETVSLMSYGFNPNLSSWSPFHGGLYAVVESISKIVATGGDYKKVRLSLQEYFEKLGDDPKRWGKPVAALLGASYAQSQLQTAAIGGKDSMSGSFKDLDVPPTLISFAVSHGQTEEIISPEFKVPGSKIGYFYAERHADDVVDFLKLKAGYEAILEGIHKGKIISAYAVGTGGVAATVSKMAFGNGLGYELPPSTATDFFEEALGSIVFEVGNKSVSDFIASDEDLFEAHPDLFKEIGRVTDEPQFVLGGIKVGLEEAQKHWESPLSEVFPVTHDDVSDAKTFSFNTRTSLRTGDAFAKPRVFIPIFPGTNCEYDTQRAFERAGAHVETAVFRNLKPQDVKASLEVFARHIQQSQIVAIPGGFSAGDEPEGSGKFIASVFRNPMVMEAMMQLIKEKDGLVLGICNGFQALVKLGLLPYGEIKALDEGAPTLTFNKIGRHVSRMANVRVSSVHSPWMSHAQVGEVYTTAFSHGEGRFYANEAALQSMQEKGQIATQYVDLHGNATMDGAYNINGSVHAIEGVFSEDGRIFGKMGHVERMGSGLYKNIPGEKHFDIFKSGVKYFK